MFFTEFSTECSRIRLTEQDKMTADRVLSALTDRVQIHSPSLATIDRPSAIRQFLGRYNPLLRNSKRLRDERQPPAVQETNCAVLELLSDFLGYATVMYLYSTSGTL